MRLAALALALVAAASAPAAPPIDPAEGRPQIQWQDARQFVGKLAFVAGEVTDVNTAGRITFVNFDRQRPARFAGVIFQENLANFPKPPAEMYAGKIVRIRGVVSTFRDQPQIIVTKPDQIEVLDALPATSVPKPPAPRSAKSGELVVAAYNLLNLFDEHDDPYRNDEVTPAKPRAELESLARSIRALDADVIAVEEVENRDYLARFVDVFLPDMGYQHIVLMEGNDMRGIDVGLISRVPIGPVRSHRHVAFPGVEGRPSRFNRDVLVVTVEPPDAPPLDVWVLHLKSNAGGREEAEPIRLAEAREVRRLLDAELSENPDARLLVMGDFNDTPESQTLSTIVGAESGALWSVHTDLADPKTLTYNEGEFRSMIDFILCSPAMARQYVKGSVHVPQGSIEATGSDHNPIVATFRTK
jgi:endonuclease/exonuclease/phosphatase family metal-dependent hydrolase